MKKRIGMKRLYSYFPRIIRVRIYKHQTLVDQNKIEDVDVRQVNMESVKDIAWWDDANIKYYESLIDRGNVCCYAYWEGKVIAQVFGLVENPNQYKKIPHKLLQNSRAAIIGNLGVKQDFRGRKISTTLIDAILRILYARGFQTIYADVEQDNIASLKSFVSAGFIHIDNHLRVMIRSRVIFNIRLKKDSCLF